MPKRPRWESSTVADALSRKRSAIESDVDSDIAVITSTKSLPFAAVPYSVQITGTPSTSKKAKRKRKRKKKSQDQPGHTQKAVVQRSDQQILERDSEDAWRDCGYTVKEQRGHKAWTALPKYGSAKFGTNEDAADKNGEEVTQIRLGDFVFIHHGNGASGRSVGRSSEDPWIARVLEIRAESPSQVYLRIFWAVDPRDPTLYGKMHSTKILLERENFSENELLASNYMDVIDAATVDDSAYFPFCDGADEALPTENLFYRWHADFQTDQLMRLRPHPTEPGVNTSTPASHETDASVSKHEQSKTANAKIRDIFDILEQTSSDDDTYDSAQSAGETSERSATATTTAEEGEQGEEE